MFASWFSSRSVIRPKDVLHSSDRVFDLTPDEWSASNHLQSHAERVFLCNNRNYNNSEVLEVTFKSDAKNMYSLFRSTTCDEAQSVFDRVKEIISLVAPTIPSSKPSIAAPIMTSMMATLRQNKEWSAPHVAAFCGLDKLFIDRHEEIVLRINEQYKPGLLTPLHVAIQSESIQVVRAILALKPNLSLTDCKGNTVFHLATMANTGVLLVMLGSSEARKMLRSKNKAGCTPIHLACYSQKENNVRELLKFGLTIKMMTIAPPIPKQRKRHREGVQLPDIDINEQYNDDDKRIRKFGKDILDYLDPTDMKYGGSPLHWVKNRKTLERLIAMGLRLNVVNMNGETAVHVVVKRHRLKCLVGLICHGAGVEDLTIRGDTPLFYAVDQADIETTQALIVFDADVNAVNNAQQSVRHKAATGNHPKHQLVLYVLSAIGAKRCAHDTEGCADGCAYDGTNEGIRLPKWPQYENCAFYSAVLMEHIVCESLNSKKKEAKCDEAKLARMICFDGGGVRGLITVQMLMELEKQLKHPINRYFDWIAGTSTGSFIATMMSTRKPLKDVRDLYFRFKDKILIGTKPYNSTNLETLIKNELGSEVTMGDIKREFDKYLIITATLVDRNPAQLHIFRSYPSSHEIRGLAEVPQRFSALPNCDGQLVWEACRASGAAPTYFRAHGAFLDGGIISNNPTLDALTEYKVFNNSLESIGKHEEIKKLVMVLSFGTGHEPTVPIEVTDVGRLWSINPRESYRSAMYYKSIGQVLINQVANTEGHVVDRAMSLCSWIHVPYFRLNPPISESISLDETDDEKIINGIWETKAFMHSMRDEVQKIVQLLACDDSCEHEKHDLIEKSHEKEHVTVTQNDAHVSDLSVSGSRSIKSKQMSKAKNQKNHIEKLAPSVDEKETSLSSLASNQSNVETKPSHTHRLNIPNESHVNSLASQFPSENLANDIPIVGVNETVIEEDSVQSTKQSDYDDSKGEKRPQVGANISELVNGIKGINSITKNTASNICSNETNDNPNNDDDKRRVA